MGSLVELARKLRPKIEELAQGLGDAEALQYKELYPQWAEGQAYKAGFKLRRRGALYRVVLAHASQAGWEPENAPTLFETIDETHAGTLEDPIPYEGNMALAQGLYYSQEGITYLCIRDTINPVYNPLADLAGLYVEVAAGE